MEERRGESSDVWMKKTGVSKSAALVLRAEANREKEYLEGPDSKFSHQGSVYFVDELIEATQGLPTTKIPLDKLKWMVTGDIDMARVNMADLRYPVIVQQLSRGLGRYVTLDGFHRVVKAIRQGDKLINAVVIDQAFIDKLTKTTLSNEGFITIEEARAAAQSQCDAEGIDPTLDNAERCTRLIDIQQGSPLMQEERQRKAAYQGNNFKSHVNNVVKNLPPTVAELQRTKHGY